MGRRHRHISKNSYVKFQITKWWGKLIWPRVCSSVEKSRAKYFYESHRNFRLRCIFVVPCHGATKSNRQNFDNCTRIEDTETAKSLHTRGQINVPHHLRYHELARSKARTLRPISSILFIFSRFNAYR